MSLIEALAESLGINPADHTGIDLLDAINHAIEHGQPTPTVLTIDVHRNNILTANDRMHWRPKADRTATLRTLGYHAWCNAGAPHYQHATIHAHITYPDHRARDVANLAPTTKALIDGMVSGPHHNRGGLLLPDDDDKHLTGPHHTSHTAQTGQTTGKRDVFRFDIHVEGTGPCSCADVGASASKGSEQGGTAVAAGGLGCTHACTHMALTRDDGGSTCE